MEIRVKFFANNEECHLFIVKGLFRIKGIYLFKVKANTVFGEPVSLKISRSTKKENIWYSLDRLRRKLQKIGKKKREYSTEEGKNKK